MASSSWVGFKSTTVVPRRDAPPIPSVDDDGWEFLLAPPKTQQDGVRLRGVDDKEESHIFSILSVQLPCPAEEDDGGRARTLAPPPPPPPLVWEQTLAWRAAAFCL